MFPQLTPAAAATVYKLFTKPALPLLMQNPQLITPEFISALDSDKLLQLVTSPKFSELVLTEPVQQALAIALNAAYTLSKEHITAMSQALQHKIIKLIVASPEQYKAIDATTKT